jgi:hypothetical protein
MFDGGYRLKLARLGRSLTYGEVERLSRSLSERYADENYVVRISVLADIENHGYVPSIFLLHSLCLIYEVEMPAVLAWYGVRPKISERPLRYSVARRGHNQRSARQLREISIAAHDFNRARGRSRLVALKRYTLALRVFSDSMLGKLSGKQQTIQAKRSGAPEFRRPSRLNSNPRPRIQPSPPESTVQMHPGCGQADSGTALKLRVLSGLAPYLGSAGATQLLESVADDREDLEKKVESMLRLFLGQTAGARLAGRIIQEAEVGE